MRVAAARLWAAAHQPYLARALFAAELRMVPGCHTIAIDRGWNLVVDPDVLGSLPTDQVGRLLIHLTGHALRDHAGRADRLSVTGAADQSRWNRCADAEINDDLLVDLCVPVVAADMPADVGGQPGGLAEAYYAAAGDGSRSWDCGSGADGAERPWDNPGLTVVQAQWLRSATAADINRLGREPGTVPGGWLRWAGVILPSRVDWRRALGAEVRAAVAAVAGTVDYTYRRPSRRFAGVRIRLAGERSAVMPSLYRPIPRVAIVCDTSGSMASELLDRALTEVDAILMRAGLRASRVPVLAVDTAVQQVRRVTSARQVVLAGGGGTDMGVGIAAAAALRPRPTVTVVLTDGFTPWPNRPPRGMRVVVGILGPGAHPRPSPPRWARAISIEPDQ